MPPATLEPGEHRNITGNALVNGQVEAARAREGRGDLAALLRGGDTWTVG